MSIKVVFYLQEGYLLLDVGCYFFTDQKFKNTIRNLDNDCFVIK